ncbi:hypothetical protein T440DRAFT_470119 [Plenodomus tracheiphilus IPT5]|uniref:F-box domain-containing protein n=1 Tax=Plenodomus tracheiphilus IPT5 TaxID=1408161 RepID=A0A6A7B1F5_9PLEO|nr:hypothetical protein T440DRAFT_470119 [Plenodomus tracheiphilus IPT5]
MPPGSNNIEEFHFKKECFVSSEILATVLASPRRLKTFTYDLSAAHLVDEDNLEQELGSMNLSIVLGCQEESLEYLSFTTSLPHVTLPRVLRFHGLRGFQSLRDLHCPYESVSQNDPEICTAFVDMFPSSLETLHLKITLLSPGEARGRCVEHLAKNCPSIAPALRELRVSPWSYYDWQECENLCSKSGLIFQADKMPDDEWVPHQRASSTHYASSSHSSDEVDLYSNDGEEQE